MTDVQLQAEAIIAAAIIQSRVVDIEALASLVGQRERPELGAISALRRYCLGTGRVRFAERRVCAVVAGIRDSVSDSRPCNHLPQPRCGSIRDCTLRNLHVAGRAI